eukprot:TRINITY_DN4826_c0_g1_i6.p1 TRINITY_DN4826_c0_g1~~TRINITY_DN4826_c0_g1_i6.p1  ORF type:complete len:1153 (+),score=221.90 TRINITY_DN4826_c0_g1_i6:77-3535(+)
MGPRSVPALAAVLACSVPAVAGSGDYVLYEDIQVPLSRHYRGQGSAGISDWENIWPNGVVWYYIETQATNPKNPSPSFRLSANEPMVVDAIAHWEEKTCARFHRCATKAECDAKKEYMYFISDASQCNSPVGMSLSRWGHAPNQINLGPDCGFGASVHEIGHSMGIAHEQSRNDRDDWVSIDFSQIKQGMAGNFEKTGNRGRAIGPYDFGSIMHYSATSFQVGNKPTIISPYSLGQRFGLSKGDVETFHFMYNTCSSNFAEPICIGSMEMGETHLIALDKTWEIEFNGLVAESDSMTVTYGGSTLPAARASYSKADGANIGATGRTNIEFTPTTADQGMIYTVSATFADGAGNTKTCSTQVEVSDARAVCFGIPSTDPKVCSGRGTCQDNPLEPCVCDSGYGGIDCSAFSTCQQNIHATFDEDSLPWSPYGASSLDSAIKVEGMSFKVGEEGGAQAQASFSISASKPNKVSVYVRAWAGESPTFSFRDGNDDQCFGVWTNGGQFSAGGQRGGTFAADTWYRLDWSMDWGRSKFSLAVDGTNVVTDANIGCGGKAVLKGVIFGNGYVDNFKLWCTNYILMTGSAMEGIVQQDVRAGGLTLTLTLVGDHDEWIDTTANKQTVLDALIADIPTGWNQRRGNVIDTSIMTVDAGDKQILTIGPFNVDGDYAFDLGNVVSFIPDGSMFKSGRTPESTPEDLSFTIPGECPGTWENGWDTDPGFSGQYWKWSTTIKKEGAGAFEHLAGGYTYKAGLAFGALRPSAGSLWTRVANCNNWGAVLSLTTDAFTLSIGQRGKAIVSGVQSGGACVENQWALVEFTFDWANSEGTFAYDGAAPKTFTLNAQQLGNGEMIGFNGEKFWVDSVKFECDRDPTYEIEPGCPIPYDDAVQIKVLPGSDALSDTTDKVAIVPQASTNCDNAEAECAALKGCSMSLSLTAAETTWHAGLLDTLDEDTMYKVCYYIGTADRWVMLKNGTDAEPFKTCGASDPTYEVSPTCPDPAKDSLTINVMPGSEQLSDANDKVALVPATAADCATAEVECATLEACSTAQGTLSIAAGETAWDAGMLVKLEINTQYKVCYYVAESDRWVMLKNGTDAEPFTTCGETPAPPTPAPDTPAHVGSGDICPRHDGPEHVGSGDICSRHDGPGYGCAGHICT